MILIQSESNDLSTDAVLDWIFYMSSRAVTRVNDYIQIKQLSHRISNTEERIIMETEQGDNIHSDSTDSYWYRRGGFFLSDAIPATKRAAPLTYKSMAHFQQENEHILRNIDTFFSQEKSSINKYQDNLGNKLKHLTAAKEAGLDIPDTLITNNVRDLLSFVQCYQCIITKAIYQHSFTSTINNYSVHFSLDTSLLCKEDIENLAPIYHNIQPLPALYQQYMEKQYELRIFYFQGTFRSMAIFSQNNAGTIIDYRNRDHATRIKCVPYQLPATIELAIECFMKKSDLNCGSIDMILTPEDRYVFLEVNPIGQYQWLAQNCNYDIDRIIASYLISSHAKH